MKLVRGWSQRAVTAGRFFCLFLVCFVWFLCNRARPQMESVSSLLPSSPFEEVAVSISFRGSHSRAVPFKLVLTDLNGVCSFGNACTQLAKGEPTGMVHDHVIQPILFSLRNGCTTSGGAPLLTVDFGANVGFFTMLLASQGCRVHAIEPQPNLCRYHKASLQLNHLEGRVRLFRAAAGSAAGYVNISNLWVLGGAQPKAISTQVIPVSELVTENTLLIKLDVDGPECDILRGLQPLFGRVTVWNIISELSFRHWPRTCGFDDAASVALMDRFYDHGYSVYLLDANQFRNVAPDVINRLGEVHNWNHLSHAFHIPRSMLPSTMALGNWSTKNMFLSKDPHMLYARYVQRLE